MRRSLTQPRTAATGTVSRGPGQPRGGYACFNSLPVVEVGSDLGAQLHELELGLRPLHDFPSLLESLRSSRNRNGRYPAGPSSRPMDVLCNTSEPASVGADLVAVAAGAGARALGVSQRACEDADPVALVYGAPTIAVVATGPGIDGLRTA